MPKAKTAISSPCPPTAHRCKPPGSWCCTRETVQIVRFETEISVFGRGMVKGISSSNPGHFFNIVFIVPLCHRIQCVPLTGLQLQSRGTFRSSSPAKTTRLGKDLSSCRERKSIKVTCPYARSAELLYATAGTYIVIYDSPVSTVGGQYYIIIG